MLANRKFIRRRGFTLIELLVVISIIGILSVMGLIGYNNAKEMARDARRKHDFSQLRLALALYYDDNGSYPLPNEEGGLGPDTSITMAGTIFSRTSNPLSPRYMSGNIADPVNSGALYYEYDTNQNTDNSDYVICMPLESKNGKWMVYYASGIGGEDFPNCPSLP